MQQERKEISGKANTIAGFSIPLYLGILALVVVCMYMDCLPAGLVGGMIALMVLGEGLNFLGNHTPVVKRTWAARSSVFWGRRSSRRWG